MEKTTRKEGTAIIIVAIVLGSLATSWYYSTYKTDDSWVDTANQLLEDAKPYPEWNTDYVMNDYFWLYENEAEQFVGNAGTSSYTASLEELLRKALSETNTQKFSPIAEADLQTMLRTNRVLAVHFRMGFEFAALNNHVWTAYFVLSEGSNPGLKGTVFVDRDVRGSEYGSGNWTGWKISPFPIVWAVIISAITAAVGLGLLVYFRNAGRMNHHEQNSRIDLPLCIAGTILLFSGIIAGQELKIQQNKKSRK